MSIETDIAKLRRLRFNARQVTNSSHGTHCSIWGDDGQGGTAENFPEPLPCNCGALINWQHERAETAKDERDGPWPRWRCWWRDVLALMRCWA